MLKVVSNTTPIIALLKIKKLSLLKNLYGKILVPEEVYFEIEKGKTKEFYTDLSQIDWIKISRINDNKTLSYFLDLDRGEAETIILSNEIEADLIIIDEKLGRLYAEKAGLKITGTLGILLKAKKLGYIQSIKPLLHELKSKKIWLSKALIKKVLILAGEK